MPECARSPVTMTVSSAMRPSSFKRLSTNWSDSSGLWLSRVDPDLGVLGHLVRRVGVDAGEVLDLPGERLLVEALGVAVLGDLVDGGVHVHLDELADQLARTASRVSLYGLIGQQIVATPLRVSRLAT